MDSATRTILEQMIDRVVAPPVRAVVVVSADGLALVHDTGLDRAYAERLAANVSGFYGLARAMSTDFDSGHIEQVMVAANRHVLLVITAGNNSRLAALADADCDYGAVGYTMTQLAARVTSQIGSGTRTALPRPTGWVGTA